MIVHAVAEPLAVPYCSVDEGENQKLCALATTLQVKADEGWISAKTPAGAGVLGGAPLERAGVTVISAGGVAHFVFEFAPKAFVMEPGQRLRVVVNAWANEVALRNNGPRIEMPTATFWIP